MPKVEVSIEVAAPRAAGATHESDVDDGLHVLGTLRREDGAEEEFVGWVALLALLQQVVTLPAS